MDDIKQKCVSQLKDVLSSVEQAMTDIKAGKYDEASQILEQLKAGYQAEKQNRKAS